MNDKRIAQELVAVAKELMAFGNEPEIVPDERKNSHLWSAIRNYVDSWVFEGRPSRSELVRQARRLARNFKADWKLILEHITQQAHALEASERGSYE